MKHPFSFNGYRLNVLHSIQPVLALRKGSHENYFMVRVEQTPSILIVCRKLEHRSVILNWENMRLRWEIDSFIQGHEKCNNRNKTRIDELGRSTRHERKTFLSIGTNLTIQFHDDTIFFRKYVCGLFLVSRISAGSPFCALRPGCMEYPDSGW